jgi:cytochrome c-type biogenesis protein CcmE
MAARSKLVLGGLLIAGVTAYMAYLGAAASWQYYVTADECLANADSMIGARVRVSGRISPNTLRIAEGRREAAFSIEGSQGALAVACTGPLPDNLAEGIDVVVEGRLDGGCCLRGDRVITRCASKYQSKASVAPAETAGQGRTGATR